jgi:hypothetical protein
MVGTNVEENLVKAYSQVFYDLLMEMIESEDGISNFNNLIEENKNKIGIQAGKKAIILARGFVKEMKERGYLDRRPSEDEIGNLFKEYMGRANHSK